MGGRVCAGWAMQIDCDKRKIFFSFFLDSPEKSGIDGILRQINGWALTRPMLRFFQG